MINKSLKFCDYPFVSLFKIIKIKFHRICFPHTMQRILTGNALAVGDHRTSGKQQKLPIVKEGTCRGNIVTTVSLNFQLL